MKEGEHMQRYAFIQPIKPGKVPEWKALIAEMTGPRKDELAASRRSAALTAERVWLQSTPMGEFAVVYWEADDIGKVFGTLLASQQPFDVWFREKILVGIHGMDPAAPPPPMNELILG
jgi:hypothetical protein